MRGIQIERVNGWQIATAIGATGHFVSWGKMGPILGTSPLDEPGEYVWFNFGETREDAAMALKMELGLN